MIQKFKLKLVLIRVIRGQNEIIKKYLTRYHINSDCFLW